MIEKAYEFRMGDVPNVSQEELEEAIVKHDDYLSKQNKHKDNHHNHYEAY